jgi:choline dehydrogenase
MAELDRRRMMMMMGRAAAVSLGAGGVGWAQSQSQSQSGPAAAAPTAAPSTDPRHLAAVYDYVVVGSGAGGGPVAVRLAEHGYRVLLLEAGPPDVPQDVYSVPAFHLLASSHPQMSWDFYVRHYTRTEQHGSRWQAGLGGMLYPRAAAVGGCTAHHAMLMTAPENDDWTYLQKVTGDPSYNPMVMAQHLATVRSWLPIEFVPPSLLLRDRTLARYVAADALDAGLPVPLPGRELDLNRLTLPHLQPDPNDPATVEQRRNGFFLIPQSTSNGTRRGTRELLLEALPRLAGRLTIQCDALAQRIILEKSGKGTVRATGVVFRYGRHQYRASPLYAPARATYSVHARREVILAGGAFNSPQLLMLSGIGEPAELKRHGLPLHVNLPAVGTNLQDRYEMSVVTKFQQPLDIAADARFGQPGDPELARWQQNRTASVYRSNGILVGSKITLPGADYPEVFIFGAPSRFAGYEPGFAAKGLVHNYFTWAVLKGWSRNRSGTVRLRSADPSDVPDINFRYFDDARGGAYDLAGVRAGLAFARSVNRKAAGLAWLDQNPGAEEFPGTDYPDDTAALDERIRREAWGHHASCSNPMGAADHRSTSVVDPRFRVHGVDGLRVVDASVFPRIPGLFIVMAIYVLAEKAAADIIADAEHERTIQ